MATQTPQATISVEDLIGTLEPLIRRIVREELARVVKKPDTFHLESDSPLYEDIEDILERKNQGEIQFYSHEEVWSE